VLHLLAARARGPRAVVVSEPSADRREQAARLGADHVVDPTARALADVLREVGGSGADVIIVAAPVAAMQAQALELASPGGRINFFGGLPRDRSEVLLDTNLIHYKELHVTGTTACTTEDCREALELVLSGAVDTAPLVSERLPLADAGAAFDAARSGMAMKVVIEP
jgi:L-iditol 2-dehydrogenase